MKTPSRFLTAILISITASNPVVACLWDYDTLAMERQRFPDVLELISGKFLRHSTAFYQWRASDREQRLQEQPSPEVYDDLAVAYEKLGDPEKAIAITLEKQKHFPGLYETHANLGTFYIHAGQLETGVQQIDIAISMNPEAHFGREVYQKHLVNYVLSKQVAKTTQLPLATSGHGEFGPIGFADFVIAAQGTDLSPKARDAELSKALKGVMGMMRFGNHDSPVLLEALGDLLLSQGYAQDETHDAKRLAARAYLKAAYGAENDATQQAYRKLARNSLAMQTVHENTYDEISLEALEGTFEEELSQAKRWFKTVADDESKWISEGADVDEAFARKYYQEPIVGWAINSELLAIGFIALASGLAGLAYHLTQKTKGNRKKSQTNDQSTARDRDNL